MVARHLLFQRQDAAVERIARHAEHLGGDDPEVVEAVERVRDVNGPDEQHVRVFRTEAVADLMQLLDELLASGKSEEDLEDKTVVELRQIATTEGVSGAGSIRRKQELVSAIRENRRSQENEESA